MEMKKKTVVTEWGILEIQPGMGNGETKTNLFISVSGPKGGNPQSAKLSVAETLETAEFMRAWAVSQIK